VTLNQKTVSPEPPECPKRATFSSDLPSPTGDTSLRPALVLLRMCVAWSFNLIPFRFPLKLVAIGEIRVKKTPNSTLPAKFHSNSFPSLFRPCVFREMPAGHISTDFTFRNPLIYRVLTLSNLNKEIILPTAGHNSWPFVKLVSKTRASRLLRR
jgi:hypothetical protein